jgi:hypothetical protein
VSIYFSAQKTKKIILIPALDNLFEQKALKSSVFAKVSAAKNLSIEPTRDEAFFDGKNLD